MNKVDVFKICPSCKTSWNTRDDFLDDSSLAINGYQVNFDDLESGLFYFTHASCGSTMALKTDAFEDLYGGPRFQESLTGSDECMGYCLKKSEFRPCPAKCECAYVREVLQIIKNWPKK